MGSGDLLAFPECLAIDSDKDVEWSVGIALTPYPRPVLIEALFVAIEYFF